ncbi:MAG: LysE family transporter [SAR202 cluster bacterium]|jgi:threonine/homoserine/homoserine lactone efflux protein|nr:LysE family transporter [SAR202 cluster bacterium]
MPTATIPVIFFTSFAVGFSGAVTPGPMLVYSIRESIRRGFIAGPLVVLGHAILELVVVVSLAVGVATFLEEDLAGFVISLLGGSFLIWMAWGMVRDPSRHVLPEGADGGYIGGDNSRPALPVLGGVLVSLSNPFWTIWWATIGLSYIVWATDLGAAGLASFYTGHILSDLVWYSLVAFAIASGRRLITRGAYRNLIVLCGLFLLALGIFFLVSSAGFLSDFLSA